MEKYKVITIGTIERYKTIAEKMIENVEKERFVSDEEKLWVKSTYDGVKPSKYFINNWVFDNEEQTVQGVGVVEFGELICGYTIDELFKLRKTKLN